MNRVMLIAAVALLPLVPVSAETPAREVGVEASIAFPSHATIRNFRADNERGVWIEDMRRNWYYVSFFGRCRDIDFAQSIAIDTRGSSRLDRFSYIIVGNERCAIDRLLTADKPLPRKEQARYLKEARAALEDGRLD
jgi:hypothetical protein